MSLKQILFGERSLTKIAAIFDSRSKAETTVLRLRQAAGMSDAQVKLVGPEDNVGVVDAPLSRKLEPESSGIWHTLLRTHVVTGTVGLVLGALLYTWLRFDGNDSIANYPFLSLVVLVFFGGIFGMLFGGLLSLRPDHYRVMAAVRKAIKRGRWAVISHPVNPEQTREVIDELHRQHINVVRSF
ncbi:MAG: hypothetical protein ACYC4K_03785 [Thiobacillus sp.]